MDEWVVIGPFKKMPEGMHPVVVAQAPHEKFATEQEAKEYVKRLAPGPDEMIVLDRRPQ